MRKVILIVILSFCTQFAYSQEEIESDQTEKHIEKPAILGLRTTIYKVSDIEKARDWYAKAFETEAYFDAPYYVGFNIGRYELGLQPEEGPTGEKTESVIAYWGVEKIQEVYDRLLSLGATENEKPYNTGGEMMTATLKDPFGNVIGLIYNPYFKLKE
ncbi:MAG: VOC family protein [Bacteroidales bacterium]|nr:VOC family protein [Bacteroidales bacterium]